MRRRTFLALAGAATLPFAARAQRARKTKRIGFLRVGEPPSSFIEPFRAGLRELGYIEGRDIEIVYGLPKTVEELNDAAAELVRLNVDVLVASGTPSVAPAKKATDVIPVVFIAAIDPVAIKVANSLAQPGGNVTGLTAVFADLTGKRLELMRELVPNLSRVVLLSRTANPGHHQYVREGERAAQQLQIELVTLTVEGANDFEAAFSTSTRRKRHTANRRCFVHFAWKHPGRTRDAAWTSGHLWDTGIRDIRRLGGTRAKLRRSLSPCSGLR